MKILVDYDLCEANARCMEVAPDIFKVDDEDNLHVLIESPGDDGDQLDASARFESLGRVLRSGSYQEA